MNATAETQSRELTDATTYVIIDTQTQAEIYRTTYANRNRARRMADKKDLAWGAVRFICKPIFA